MSNLTIYIFGFLVVIGGLVWAAVILGLPPIWIAVGAIVLLGIGIATSVSRTRRKEAPEG